MISTIRYILYLLILTMAVPVGVLAGNPKIPTAEHLLNNSAQGREFWIAIPPNEVQGYGFTRAVELYVTSSYDTEVTLEAPGFGLTMTKKVKAWEITVFSDDPQIGGMNWEYEVRKSEEITNKGLRLTADQPISVYVMTARTYTSEGYLALPTNVWGTHYMHLGYYDFKDGGGERGSGFLIVAQDDGTVLDVTLSGSATFGRTMGGKPIGYRYRVQLARGQTWMVHGSGKDPSFDISGTQVFSNKPVGMISFHMRSIIPAAAAFNSRDILCEMPPPVTAWGKRYVTVELKRKDRGDFFRIIASQPDTKFSVKYYDKDTRALIGQKSGTLQRAGDYAEYEEIPLNPSVTSIRGTSVWEADKPILVMQYSYSAGWDGADFFDPFMVLVVPQEQYITGTVFQTPARATFATNWFNIIAEGDPNDPEQKKLRTIELDDQPIHTRDTRFLVNNIPGTNLYWARINVKPGAHKVRGEARFGGYIYGFDTFESYGWPAAMAINKIDQLDTLEPELTFEEDCGDFEILATEVRDGASKDNPRQIDQGISAIELIKEKSYNYALELITSDKIVPDPKVSSFKFKLTVIDRRKDAKAYFTVLDRAGNVAYDSVEYISDVVEMNPMLVDFGRVRVGTDKDIIVELVNPKNRVTVVSELKLETGSVFEIIDAPATPFDMQPLQRIPITLRYAPTREVKSLSDPKEVDLDLVLAKTECNEFELAELQGRGVLPHIRVADWNADIWPVNYKFCHPTGILVENIGTDVLTITGISGYSAPFTLSDPTEPPLPIVLQPGEKVILKQACFQADQSGTFRQDIKFDSDAPDPGDPLSRGDKNISVWTGAARIAEIAITPYHWVPERREGSVNNEGRVFISNHGSATLRLKSIRMRTTPDADFRIDRVTNGSDQKAADVSPDGYSASFGGVGVTHELAPWRDSDNDGTPDEPTRMLLKVWCSFMPQDIGLHENEIVAVYIDNNGDDAETDGGYLTGTGILPIIGAEGFDFDRIECGNASAQQGFVTIRNTSDNEALEIQGVTLENELPDGFDGGQVFQWVNRPSMPFSIPIGGSVDLEVRFTTEFNAGQNWTVPVTILSDAHRDDAPEQPRVTTVNITGACGTTAIEVDPLVFPDELTCEVRQLCFQVRNPNATPITNVQISLNDPNGVFTIINPNIPSIAANQGADVCVEFVPPRDGGVFSATATVSSDNTETVTTTIDGEAHYVSMTFKLEDNDQDFLPGDKISLMVDVTNDPSNKYADVQEAAIEDMTVKMTYDGKAVKFVDVDASALQSSGWSLVPGNGGRIYEYTRNGNEETVTFQLRGIGAPIPMDGDLFPAIFHVFMSDKDEIDIDLDVQVNPAERAICVRTESLPGSVDFGTFCLNTSRIITLDGTRYGLAQNQPNPVGNSTTIEYGVGIPAHVSIVLYNSMGEQVQVLVDKHQESGVYQLDLSTVDLSAGVYSYRMQSGPYSETRTMVITK